MSKHKKKFIFSFAITLGVLVGVILVAFGAGALVNVLSRPPIIPTHVEIENPADIMNENSDGSPQIIAVLERKPLFYTFLLFGIDSGNNVDAIVIGALDVENRQAYAISVPRDTLVDVPRNLRKPVASYAVGRGGGRGHEGGVAQVYAEMQTLFGFRPDFYISVNEQAFIRIVDSVGGVQINVPFHMRYDDPAQNLHINIAEGTQILNGQQALHFARYRLANPGFRAIRDYERIENQQQIMRALFAELLTPRTIARVPELIEIYQAHVRTNMDNREMIWFGGRLNQLRGATISTYTLPTRGTSGAPGWYELPDEEAILELINRTVNPFTENITSEMVSILNE